VAHFMYQCNRGTRVTLYVRSDMGGNRSTAFRYAREGTVGVFYWVDSKVGYAVSSSDISKEDLLNVANAAYQQLNPP
jgi:anti-sigma factor RsiW